ncbi:MAG: hypothetical protein AAFX50_25400, partial [Acidobacteriota bacterium]
MPTIERNTAPVPALETPAERRATSFASLALAALIAVALAGPSYADAVRVETTAPTSTVDCTLGDAIATVLGGTDVGACTVVADNLGPDNVWVRLPDAAAYALDAPVVVDGELHIFGEPAATAPASIVWAAGSAGRFFDVAALGDLTLSRVEVSGGDAASGGAVRVAAGGVGTFNGTKFAGNTASFAGGAISNAGILAITRSTFSANQSTFGGALHNHGDGVAVIINSLFAANSASSGGAIYQNGSMTSAVDVKNTTLSANAGFYGGAYYGKSGDGSIDFSTLRNNTAQAGGAVFMEWGTLAIGRSAWTQEGT